MTTARQKVFAYLKKNRAVSAAQVARALNLSAPTVRHHLSVLCSDGRAAQVGSQHKDGRGRPLKLYGLSEGLMGNNLALLSDLVLSESLERIAPGKRQQVLEAMAKGLIRQMIQLDFKGPAAQRLAVLIENLSRLNYQARWEAGAQGPRISFGHCPYAAIIAKHPELCRMDAMVLSDTTNQFVRQSAQIGVAESPACVFQLS